MVPGGLIATQVGGKRLLAISMLGSVAASLVAPPITQMGSPAGLVIVRSACGLAQGSLCPAWANVIKTDLSPALKNLASAAFSAGSSAGIIAMWVSGPHLQAHYGWPANFYVPAALGLVWVVLWELLGPANRPKRYESPSSPSLSSPLTDMSKAKETVFTRVLCEEGRAFPSARALLSWTLAMFGEPVCLGVFLSTIAVCWNYYLLLSFLPQYMHEIYQVDLQHAAELSVVPYAVCACFVIASGSLSDRIIESGRLSIIQIRKLMTVVSLLGPAAVFFCLASLQNESEWVAVLLLTVGVSLASLNNLGATIAPIEIFSEETAALAYSINYFFGTVAGLVAPIITGLILDKGGCPKEWDQTATSANGTTTTVAQRMSNDCKSAWDAVFYVTVAISCCGCAMYTVVGGRHPFYSGLTR